MEKEKIKKEPNDELNDNVEKSESVKEEQEDPKKELSQEEKIVELEEKIKRTYAEMENQRRRYEKERDDAFEYGGFSFAKESLNLIDNLERSKTSLQNDDKLKNTEALTKINEHLDIICKDMLSILKKNNIEPIKSINEKLNPNCHQAMMEVEDNQKEAGTIVQEIQKGFMMKDRLLRPALVCVSKKAQKTPDNSIKSDEKKENNEKK